MLVAKISAMIMPMGSKKVVHGASSHSYSYTAIPIDNTKAVIRILNKGSLYPPKNPTITIIIVAIAAIKGIIHATEPMLVERTAAVTMAIATTAAIVSEMGWRHTFLNCSHSDSSLGGVRTLAPCLARLSST